MSMWNYRLIKEENGAITIGEVYYNDDNDPFGYVNASIIGEDKNEVKEEYEILKEAFDYPVLNAETDFATMVLEE